METAAVVAKPLCAHCGRGVVGDPPEPGNLYEFGQTVVCAFCRRDFPRALLKAFDDQFDYMAGLSGGIVVRFASATIHGPWVTFDEVSKVTPAPCVDYNFERGMEVRLSTIKWIVDAPQGS